MKYFLELITEVVQEAFKTEGYSAEWGKVIESNRPDLCEYQCNGALACAKKTEQNPMEVAAKITGRINSEMISRAEVVKPGFINLTVSSVSIADYLNVMKNEEKYGLQKIENPQMIVLDYGGPNVAKPLHVGHLRPAIIGEAIKRLEKYVGHRVVGDVHLGDWGMPMGLIIAELSERYPQLPYFDESYQGQYSIYPPFCIAELEEIYPIASSKAKQDAVFKIKALECTKQLQEGRRGYRVLWRHILDISIKDLKINYKRLKVEFDLWYGESDADKYIADMVERMKKEGYAYFSENALVVDVSRKEDKKEIPPCIILKSDGASLYETSDLAAIVQREQDYHPDCIAYVVDKRQELHFEQVFRCARKTHLISEKTNLKFIGFGTMNGKDGRPFKTRDGGVMKLIDLLTYVTEKMYDKITENKDLSEKEAIETAELVGLAAIKYGDLSNQASKDYIFDIERFTSFEGKTGPYILYTLVRIKSIINQYVNEGHTIDHFNIITAKSTSEKQLMIQLIKFNYSIMDAANNFAPHKVCSFIYELTNIFNTFYHEKKILTEKIEAYRESLIALSLLTHDILIDCIEILGFTSPEKM